MENIFWYIVLAVYGIWSIRWGLRFVNGRWAALEQPKMRVVKVIISIVIGAVFGVFYLVWRGVKLILIDLPRLFES